VVFAAGRLTFIGIFAFKLGEAGERKWMGGNVLRGSYCVEYVAGTQVLEKETEITKKKRMVVRKKDLQTLGTERISRKGLNKISYDIQSRPSPGENTAQIWHWQNAGAGFWDFDSGPD